MYKPDDEIVEGKYKIIKKLGNGAFGDIFRGKLQVPNNVVQRKRTGELYAAKIVSSHLERQ
jgi:hypothetical protein